MRRADGSKMHSIDVNLTCSARFGVLVAYVMMHGALNPSRFYCVKLHRCGMLVVECTRSMLVSHVLLILVH